MPLSPTRLRDSQSSRCGIYFSYVLQCEIVGLLSNHYIKDPSVLISIHTTSTCTYHSSNVLWSKSVPRTSPRAQQPSDRVSSCYICRYISTQPCGSSPGSICVAITVTDKTTAAGRNLSIRQIDRAMYPFRCTTMSLSRTHPRHTRAQHAAHAPRITCFHQTFRPTETCRWSRPCRRRGRRSLCTCQHLWTRIVSVWAVRYHRSSSSSSFHPCAHTSTLDAHPIDGCTEALTCWSSGTNSGWGHWNRSRGCSSGCL